MKLVLPFPDSRLLPNVKLHWARKAEAAKAARYLAWVEAHNWVVEAMSRRCYQGAFQSCNVSITWYPPDKRRRDEDNYARAMKPYMDGLVDAGILLDDSNRVIKHIERHFGEPDKSNPRTELEIEPL